MAQTIHKQGPGTLTDRLESMKTAGLIRKYSVVWETPGEAPRILLWKAADTPDGEVVKTVAEGLAGLAIQSQLVVQRE